MPRVARFGQSLILLTVAVFLLAFPYQLKPQAVGKGNLIGYVYDNDGTTPVPGAVVKLKNISSGAIYLSGPTDKQGIFKVEGLSKGIYSFGITTSQGDFNSNEIIGILENETTRISISLSLYEGSVQSAMQEILREQQEKEGEARIGHVIQYLPDPKEAVVFIEKGLLQLDDRIRVRGPITNFYQDVKSLKLEGEAVRRALAGQNPNLKVVKSSESGDIVYIVCKKGITPFFLTPCGIAAIVAGGAGVITLIEDNPVSPFKK